jgi:hypothetical protein
MGSGSLTPKIAMKAANDAIKAKNGCRNVEVRSLLSDMMIPGLLTRWFLSN